MRKILLAGAAMLATTGMAMALGSDTITVSTTLAQACSVSITSTSVTMPSDGNLSGSEAFSYQCNYASGTTTLTFDSGFNGVSADGGTTTFAYNITPSTGAAGTSAAPFNNTPVVNAVANAPSNASFTVDLLNPLAVAGTYTDTLTISIAP
jgi:hypothetical protein